MRKALFLLLACLPMSSFAQQLKTEGTSAADLTPEGWEVKEASGELNKDGHLDLVILATPNMAENMMTRDDGYVFNFNQPILAIYFGKADGGFKLWKKYEDIIAHQVDEYIFVTSSLSILPQGTLKISLEYFASAGTSTSSTDSYTFRYQGGDFMLIGKDMNSLSRFNGKSEEISINYLTRKCKTTTCNVFKDEVKPREVWKTLPKAPLKRLGEFRIE